MHTKQRFSAIAALLIFLAGPGTCSAQQIPAQHLVVLRDSQFITKTYIENTRSNIRYRSDTPYFYYYQETIRESYASATGLLLDGPYESFFIKDNRLHAQGMFAKGLKKGIWRYWSPNNRLQREEHWTNGRLHGSFREYNDDGTLLRKGRYRKGALQGCLRYYADGKPQRNERYKNGRLLDTSQKRRFQLPFKKKQ